MVENILVCPRCKNIRPIGSPLEGTKILKHFDIVKGLKKCSICGFIWKPEKVKKCYFCGDSKIRTEEGLNKVKYKLKHPISSFWRFLLGMDWVYACQDCTDYMKDLYGTIKIKEVN